MGGRENKWGKEWGGNTATSRTSHFNRAVLKKRERKKWWEDVGLPSVLFTHKEMLEACKHLGGKERATPKCMRECLLYRAGTFSFFPILWLPLPTCFPSFPTDTFFLLGEYTLSHTNDGTNIWSMCPSTGWRQHPSLAINYTFAKICKTNVHLLKKMCSTGWIEMDEFNFELENEKDAVICQGDSGK